MSSVAKVLREEIARVSRVQFRSMGARLRKSDAAIRRAQTDLKRRIVELSATVKLLASKAVEKERSGLLASEEEAAGLVITGRMVRSLRHRLGVSQENLARLLSVTAQSVYLWERKGGKLKLRANTARGLAAVRKMTRTEAQDRLNQIRPGNKLPAKK